MNAHNAELWQTFLTIVLNFMIGTSLTLCVFVILYGVIFIILRFIQLVRKESSDSKKAQAEKWAKENPSSTSNQIRNEWGYVQLSKADEMVMTTMGSTAQLDYVTNKINIFRGSTTPIEIVVKDGPGILNRSRIQWREI